METHMERIKCKNPFLYIIKLSEEKKRKPPMPTSASKNNKFISPILIKTSNANEGKKNLPQASRSNSKRSKLTAKSHLERSSSFDMFKKTKVINCNNSQKILEQKLKDKEKELAEAKNQIDDLSKENEELKAKVSQYQERINSMANDVQIMSKETLSKEYFLTILVYNYFVGVNNEIMNSINNDIAPNLDKMTYEELLALEDKIGYVNRGFSKEKIDKIPAFKYKKSDFKNQNVNEDKCVICQFDISEGSMIKKLSCEHFYHEECINAWLLKEKNCPFCKEEVVIN